MKLFIITIVALATISSFALAQDTQVIKREVETSCGQCQFGLSGDGCDLAVKIDGNAYYVEGTGINDHGDAHGTNGFCNAVRKANVEGKVVDGKFVATKFELIESEKKKG